MWDVGQGQAVRPWPQASRAPLWVTSFALRNSILRHLPWSALLDEYHEHLTPLPHRPLLCTALCAGHLFSVRLQEAEKLVLELELSGDVDLNKVKKGVGG